MISTQEQAFDVSVYLGALLVTWWTSDDKSRFSCVVGGSGRAWEVCALRSKANHDALVAELSRMLMRSHSLNTYQIRSSGQRHRDSRWSESPRGNKTFGVHQRTACAVLNPITSTSIVVPTISEGSYSMGAHLLSISRLLHIECGLLPDD